jgi:hypothetical protein
VRQYPRQSMPSKETASGRIIRLFAPHHPHRPARRSVLSSNPSRLITSSAQFVFLRDIRGSGTLGRVCTRSIPVEGGDLRVRRSLDHEWHELSRMRRRCPWISADHDSCPFVKFVVRNPSDRSARDRGGVRAGICGSGGFWTANGTNGHECGGGDAGSRRTMIRVPSCHSWFGIPRASLYEINSVRGQGSAGQEIF